MNRPWLTSTLALEDRVDSLLAAMTIEEKIGQMHQIHESRDWDKNMLRKGLVGSLFNASGANAGGVRDEGANVKHTNELQKIAVEESRLGVPLLFARDVIHGHRTVFPIPLGQAATWNPQLVRDAAVVTAREASSEGIRWTFTPMMDVSRDPRWGRIAESFGECPFLASRMAEAAVRGYQGDDLSRPDTMAACAKHFAGYAGAEGGKDYWETHCGEREMRDVYLPPFHAAVKAGVATIMSAFHVNDSVPASGDKHLLSDILRGEWGFDGFVVSDYGIVSEMHSGHGVCESVKDAAALAANAGLDMDMMANAYLKYLKELIDEGRVAMALVDEAVRRIIRIKFRCGLFEHPYADESLPVKVLLAPNHVALARSAAAASTVLLRNTGVLPLTPDQGKILVTGPFARARSELFGCWTLDGRAEDATALCDAIKAAAGASCSVHVDNEACFGDLTPMLALRADVVIACIGEAPWRSGEGNSIAAIDLPTGQLEMLKHLHELGKPIIAVVFAGRPLAISWLEEHCDAVLYAWHPGIEAGNAVADILFGRAEPSGRLPVSFPRSSGHIPAHYYHRPTHRPGTLWNDNAWYRDAKHTPLYPFGFGLGYTTFKYRDLKVSPAVAALNGTVSIEVTVENTGAREGTETIQLYVRDLKASVSRPIKELKGFTQVTLKPGESRRVQLTLASSDLSFTGIDMRPTVEAGEFKVWVGSNSAEGLESGFELR